VPIEKKESIRWLENLRQSTELLGDPKRCVHIGDRESDIYELFCLAQKLETHFLVRTCVDRLARGGTTTLAAEMKASELRGLHSLQVRNQLGKITIAVLDLRFQRLVVRPPIGKEKDYPKRILTVIHATEKDTPKDRELEAAHGLASALLPRCHREVGMVLTEMEDRDLSQNPQVQMPGGRSETENR
jgi:hypothetical protein